MEAIPVTERLPEARFSGDAATVLAYSFLAQSWHPAIYDTTGHTWHVYGCGDRLDHVTHWQPLPEPPSAPRVEQPPSVPTLPGVVVPVPVEERLPEANRWVMAWNTDEYEWVPAVVRTAPDGKHEWLQLSGETDITITPLVTHWCEELPMPEDAALDTDLLTALAAIGAEVARARSMWPAFNTLHEGYAIIAEELDEVWQHVKVKQGKRDSAEVRKELLETAAMCVRAVLDLQHTGFNK